ncbi:hypothetical protein J6590_009822 [Homalodisca vitripennis]|nr:hypothetical protein J6590_009822 [Homalodisca vitripennis]
MEETASTRTDSEKSGVSGRSSWGINAQVLRTTSLLFVYSTTEYYAQDRCSLLKRIMRTIGGIIMATHLPWILELSNKVPQRAYRDYVQS